MLTARRPSGTSSTPAITASSENHSRRAAAEA
jgi:hypothetical protein